MHGRPRENLQTPIDEDASALKSCKIRSLQSQFLENHHNNIWHLSIINRRLTRKIQIIKSIIDEELRVVEIALRKNYKSYGAWHHRKWVLSKGNSSTERELKLLNLFQKQDTRNFHAWNYRRFIAGLRNISDEKELQFTTDMINDNFSNYSAWHNRRYRHLFQIHWLTGGAMCTPISLLEKKVEGYFPKEIFLKEEYEFVRNAVFTDPDDQSVNLDTVSVQVEDDVFKNITWRPLSANKFNCSQAWSTHVTIPLDENNSSKIFQVKISSEYSQGITSLNGVPCSQLWCFTFRVSVCNDLQLEGQSLRRILMADEHLSTIDRTSNVMNLFKSYFELASDYEQPTPSKWKSEMIASEIDQYRELLSWAECKIGKLTLARLIMANAMISDTLVAPNKTHMEEVLQLYSELMKLDPTHYQYYKDEYSLVFLKLVTSSKESLMKYCWQYKESTSLNIAGDVHLRLNTLSLSRIGSFERLLWVQSLDLSHNQLLSIEGLEALQLLSLLNLSHNKLGSFMALDPLRFLKSLRVLDISYNEIGAHTVDTRRYLCSSPLSHTLDYDKNFEEFASDDEKVVNFWEAYSVFGGLDIMQLDITGNAIVDERFVVLLVKLIPGLKWLDGKELH
ncbi:hypothetical protein E3N88_42479 [Mikania micrantha]|uniref:Geranylgeranyl transferase type-2 subunit alpha n=1 Tax=Mikania micrantha TaxID=192012 RepID=A0A5N6LHS0_9ASTR|nr:hypothetical protein E3N88_42479 [Mikania micrantha]